MPYSTRFFVSFILILLSGFCLFAGQTCTYTDWVWNVFTKKAVNVQTVTIPYNQKSKEAVDAATGCSLCSEDQQKVKAGKVTVQICKKYAPQLQAALNEIAASGFSLYEVTGYRVGKTKGDPDAKGNRTQYSNHSFGTAVDINSLQNGLYDRCVVFGPGCRLLRGGRWDIDQKGRIVSGSRVVEIMKKYGFKWGGEIAGDQKDFMHFSLTGY